MIESTCSDSACTKCTQNVIGPATGVCSTTGPGRSQKVYCGTGGPPTPYLVASQTSAITSQQLGVTQSGSTKPIGTVVTPSATHNDDGGVDFGSSWTSEAVPQVFC